MASETFSPEGPLRPDWNAAGDWSGASVPQAGTLAVINAVDVWVDPQTEIAADVTLEGGAALIGNGGGFAIVPTGVIEAKDLNALYGVGAIVNQGSVLVNAGASLSVVVQAGGGIANGYGLAVPSFENTGMVSVADGGTLDLSGTEFSNTGTVLVDDGILIIAGGWVDGGQGPLTPGGVIELARGGYAEFADGVADQSFVFDGPGTIAFNDGTDVDAVAIDGFGYRDEIIVDTVAEAESLADGGLLFITPLPAHYTLAVSSLASGQAMISMAYDDNVPPCLVRGTGILTPAGQVPVERIKPGDLVLTLSGDVRPVRWVGWRTLDLARHARPNDVRPVLIRAGAIAGDIPSRDLRLSPDHALFLDGVLVPAKLLTNNATIIRDTKSLAITYYHVELDSHDILHAENLSVESYIDTGNRAAFDHASGAPAAPKTAGRGTQWGPAAYAEFCVGGPKLHAVRATLFARLATLGYRHQTMHEITLVAAGQNIAKSSGVPWLPCFRLPPGHNGVVAIRSTSFVPAEMTNAEDGEDDWRRLGIAIRRIKLDLRSLAARDIARAGLHHRAKSDRADWTDGNAIIAVPPETAEIGLNIAAFPKTWLAPFGAITPD